jgi:phytoene dehydrogenase-like protein
MVGNRYDTIIIGRDLSSLIAALVSLRHGKTALVMEGVETGPREAGYAFSFDPRPLAGMADGQLLARHFADILPAAEILSPNRPMDPAFQVILPDHRIDFFENRERLIGDLVREFPDQEHEINRFYRSVSRADRSLDSGRRIEPGQGNGGGLETHGTPSGRNGRPLFADGSG